MNTILIAGKTNRLFSDIGGLRDDMNILHYSHPKSLSMDSMHQKRQCCKSALKRRARGIIRHQPAIPTPSKRPSHPPNPSTSSTAETPRSPSTPHTSQSSNPPPSSTRYSVPSSRLSASGSPPSPLSSSPAQPPRRGGRSRRSACYGR